MTPRACPLLPLAVGAAPLAAHQGLDGDVEVPPGRSAAAGGHPPAGADAGNPNAPNLWPVLAIHQIRPLALGEQLQPTISTDTEAQAAHAALVHEILSVLRSALMQRVGNPRGP